MPNPNPTPDAAATFELTKSCWFIERKQEPRWLAGFDYDNPVWTNEPNDAVRFCREADASVLCKQFGLFNGIGEAAQSPFPSEHVFCSGGNSPDAVVFWARRYVAAVDAMKAVHDCQVAQGASDARVIATGSRALRIRNECMANLRRALQELDREKGTANV